MIKNLLRKNSDKLNIGWQPGWKEYQNVEYKCFPNGLLNSSLIIPVNSFWKQNSDENLTFLI